MSAALQEKLIPMSKYDLVADIGATNARFALTHGSSPELLRIKVLACADYPNLQTAVADYLASANAVGLISKACIAIAGTVHLPEFSLANNHWRVNKAQVNAALKVETLWVNDFTAQAWAMSEITPEQLLLVKPGQSEARGNRLVMGPGTGIGVAGLIAHDQGWLPVMGEGGHVSFAPANQLQSEILAFMWRQYGHVSTERLLSGSGMMDLYAAVAHTNATAPRLTSPADILQQAQLATPDDLAQQTLHIFCDMLGNAVANGALMFGAVGGVYLTGGILPRMYDFLLASTFNQSFIDKGRTSTYLQQIPIFLCTAEQPGLQGAAIALQHESGL
jgi:glucokinase|tara:strand:+ start:6057 stop:7055 length:999 start_codon:yes stop_codon:yes gene_type:complete